MTEKIFEYIIIGPPDVGKTSIMNRYLDNMFYTDSYNTIGVDMRTKKLNNLIHENITINIYDTAGQERYFSLTTNFIRNKDCIFLLLGNFAKSKEKFIENKDRIITGVHPSPFSANNGFFNSPIICFNISSGWKRSHFVLFSSPRIHRRLFLPPMTFGSIPNSKPWRKGIM